MTRNQREDLEFESLDTLKALQSDYAKKLNDHIAKYTLEKDWNKAMKLDKKIEVLRKDCDAIDNAIFTKKMMIGWYDSIKTTFC